MMLDAQRIDPVAFARYMRERVASSSINGHVPSWGPQFGIRTGSPDEWARFYTMVQQQESGHRLAPVNPDGTLARFPTTPSGERSYGPGQFNVGEYGLKTWQDVNDPRKVADAYVKVAESGNVPRYFGSVQRPHETLQHAGWYDKTVAPKLAGPSPYGEDSWLDSGTQQQPTNALATREVPSKEPRNRLMASAAQPGPNALSMFGDSLMQMGKRPQSPQPQFGYSPIYVRI